MKSTAERLVRSARQFLVLGLVFAAPLIAQEQTTAVWHGLLRNSAGAPIARTAVQLIGNTAVQTTTADNGTFTFSNLPQGKYKLTIVVNKRTVAYAQTIEVVPAAPGAVVTLSSHGEITVAAMQETSATGVEGLSSQKANELPRLDPVHRAHPDKLQPAVVDRAPFDTTPPEPNMRVQVRH